MARKNLIGFDAMNLRNVLEEWTRQITEVKGWKQDGKELFPEIKPSVSGCTEAAYCCALCSGLSMEYNIINIYIDLMNHVAPISVILIKVSVV